MRNLSTLFRGRVRLARGRCPACASETVATHDCGVCRGYQGPFPADDQTLLRWSWRFEGTLPHAAVEERAGHWSGVAEPLAR